MPRRRNTPEPVTTITWAKAEDYTVPISGLDFPKGGARSFLAAFNKDIRDNKRSIRTMGKFTDYDLEPRSFDAILEGFASVPTHKTPKQKADALQEWLREYGFPFVSTVHNLPAWTIYSAACSTRWLISLNELCSIEQANLAGARGHLEKLIRINHKPLIGVRRNSLSNRTWMYFEPEEIPWYGVFVWEPTSLDSGVGGRPLWLGRHDELRFLDQLAVWYLKSKPNIHTFEGLRWAAKNYLRNALKTILLGVRPSMEWQYDIKGGDWILVPSLAISNPWQALNYALYRRVLDQSNTYRLCKFCKKPFHPKRSTGQFCSTLCRVKHNQALRRH